MWTVDLPKYDTPTGAYTPIVLAAIAEGARGSSHRSDPDKITLSFRTKKAADAFAASIRDIDPA